MTVIYYEEDADLAVLQDKAVGIIGYQTIARNAARNMRESGLVVAIGGSMEERERALHEGFRADTIANVTRAADVILLLMPDETMTPIYMQEISPNLHKGNALIFASAYNFAFGYIEPPGFVDVGLVAPRTIANTLRPGRDTLRPGRQEGTQASYVAVWQDASRRAWDRVLAVARAMGALQNGAIEMNIGQEAELSLFVQQALVPTLIHTLMTAAQLLMKQGYPAEAVLTDLYLSGKFSDYVQQIAQKGIRQTFEQMSQVGQYGSLSRMDRFNDLKLERLMEITLDEIRSGDFAKEWTREFSDGLPRLNKLGKQLDSNELWELEQQTLDLMGYDASGNETDDDLV